MQGSLYVSLFRTCYNVTHDALRAGTIMQPSMTTLNVRSSSQQICSPLKEIGRIQDVTIISPFFQNNWVKMHRRIIWENLSDDSLRWNFLATAIIHLIAEILWASSLAKMSAWRTYNSSQTPFHVLTVVAILVCILPKLHLAKHFLVQSIFGLNTLWLEEINRVHTRFTRPRFT